MLILLMRIENQAEAKETPKPGWKLHGELSLPRVDSYLFRPTGPLIFALQNWNLRLQAGWLLWNARATFAVGIDVEPLVCRSSDDEQYDRRIAKSHRTLMNDLRLGPSAGASGHSCIFKKGYCRRFR